VNNGDIKRKTKMMTISKFLLASVAAVALCHSHAAQAQNTFPSKTITVIVPFAAGGASDIIARLVGKSLGETLGQQVIIENVGGAGGTAGAARLAKSEPDGHTLLVHHLAITASASLYKALPYKASEAFAPIGLINSGPYVITARLGFPANNAQEMLAHIKRENGKVTMAHSGIGAGSHLCATLLSQAIGADVNQIAYRGASQSTQDIISENVDLLCEQTVTALPHLEGKKMKGFAVTSITPVAQLPGIPTLDQAGVKGFDLTNWHGLYAPQGTPQPVIEKLNAALQKALADKEVQEKFATLGTEIFPPAERTPAAHATKFQSELARWTEVTKKAGIQPQ
jgi:tripartite-type tricarboxylate transporter receptor subunit TctC